MKSNNSYGKVEFIVKHIYWALIIWMLYKNFLFRCVASFSFTDSRLILLGVVVIICVLGILTNLKFNRNAVSIFFNLVLAYGIYTVMAYIEIRRTLILVSLSVAAALSVIYAILVMSRRIKKGKAGKVICRRIFGVVNVTVRLCGIGLAVIMLVTCGNLIFGSSIMKSRAGLPVKGNDSEQMILDNMETISLLNEQAWSTLSLQEKLNVLQLVADIEQIELGLPNALNVGAANLEENLMGYYLDNTYEIIVSIDMLQYGSSLNALDTICHEAYHSYQYRIVDAFMEADEGSKNLRLFTKAKLYMNELENYIDASKDIDGYSEQECEKDANMYSRIALYRYYEKANECISGKCENDITTTIDCGACAEVGKRRTLEYTLKKAQKQ